MSSSVIIRPLVIVPVFNEEHRVRGVLDALSAITYDVLVVDDGSDDATPVVCSTYSEFRLIRHLRNQGIGSSIRDGIMYAQKNGYNTVVIIAGNGKMRPSEIPSLLEPIIEGTADYVQGSRYIQGGNPVRVPRFRQIMIKAFTYLSNIVTGFYGTDVTCGFRAYNIDKLFSIGLEIEMEYLDKYELEFYIHYKAIKKGLRVVEVPVSMIYPEDGQSYSKIIPFIGWWSMVKPWLCLSLGIWK